MHIQAARIMPEITKLIFLIERPELILISSKQRLAEVNRQRNVSEFRPNNPIPTGLLPT